jgi:hypothetical protein
LSAVSSEVVDLADSDVIDFAGDDFVGDVDFAGDLSSVFDGDTLFGFISVLRSSFFSLSVTESFFLLSATSSSLGLTEPLTLHGLFCAAFSKLSVVDAKLPPPKPPKLVRPASPNAVDPNGLRFPAGVALLFEAEVVVDDGSTGVEKEVRFACAALDNDAKDVVAEPALPKAELEPNAGDPKDDEPKADEPNTDAVAFLSATDSDVDVSDAAGARDGVVVAFCLSGSSAHSSQPSPDPDLLPTFKKGFGFAVDGFAPTAKSNLRLAIQSHGFILKKTYKDFCGLRLSERQSAWVWREDWSTTTTRESCFRPVRLTMGSEVFMAGPVGEAFGSIRLAMRFAAGDTKLVGGAS